MPEQSDHDILITIVEQVKQLRLEVKELKDNSAHRLDLLETEVQQKLSSREFGTFLDKNFGSVVSKVSKLERWQSMIVGALTLFNILLGLAVAYYSSQH